METRWCPSGYHIISMWKPHGFYMDTMWLSHGHHIVSYRSHVVSMWTPLGFQMDTTWFPGGQYLVYMWMLHSFHIDTTWFPHGHQMVSTWTPHGVQEIPLKLAQKQLCMKPTGFLVTFTFISNTLGLVRILILHFVQSVTCWWHNRILCSKYTLLKKPLLLTWNTTPLQNSVLPICKAYEKRAKKLVFVTFSDFSVYQEGPWWKLQFYTVFYMWSLDIGIE